MNSISVSRRPFWATLLLSVALGCGLFTAPASAEWVVDGNVVTFVDAVGYSADSSAFAGTVALRMESVTISGQFKIITTIIGVVPEPGFTYVVKKSGGVDSPVEIQFTSATCSSKFSFLYKPGLTKIDYGVMRCR